MRRAMWIVWHPEPGPPPPPVNPEFTGAAQAGQEGRDKSPLVDLRGEAVEPGQVALVPEDFLTGLRKHRMRDPKTRRFKHDYLFGEGKTRAGDRSKDGTPCSGPYYGKTMTPNGEFEVIDATKPPRKSKAN